MRAKIKSKAEVVKQTLLVVYDLLGESVDFQAGQYFFVTLLNAPIKDQGKDPRHHFTILNSPNENNILSHATRIRQTPFKQSLIKMPVGSEVEVDSIGGDFVLPDAGKPVVFIALGIGITPYISMLRYIKEQNLPHRVTLFYSDSDKASLAFLEELENYKRQNPNFKMIITITEDPNWPGEKRRINAQVIRDYLTNLNEYVYFVSGPPQAVEAVGRSLSEAGIERENINLEDFSGY